MHKLSNLLRFDGLLFPKGMPSDAILKYIISPSPSKNYLPRMHKSGKRIPPKISYGMQHKIRQTCAMINIDPVTIGLPPVESPIEIYNSLPDSDFIPAGRGRELKRLLKQIKIQENMSKMDTKIQEWKSEKKLSKSKPELPF